MLAGAQGVSLRLRLGPLGASSTACWKPSKDKSHHIAHELGTLSTVYKSARVRILQEHDIVSHVVALPSQGLLPRGKKDKDTSPARVMFVLDQQKKVRLSSSIQKTELPSLQKALEGESVHAAYGLLSASFVNCLAVFEVCSIIRPPASTSSRC